MPAKSYLPEHLGSASLTPTGAFTAGSYASFVLTYTAGTFGIDDSGCLKIVWRGTSDMGKPQFKDPAAPNYTTVEASNGAVLDYSIGRTTTRPWSNTLLIRVGRGFLRKGDTITIRLGDTSQGSPGLRLQTNVEPTFEFKVMVDAFATFEFTELPSSPEIALVPGPAARWKAIVPTLNVAGEPFRLGVVAEDIWGNPTSVDTGSLTLACPAIPGLPAGPVRYPASGVLVLEGLTAPEPGDALVEVTAADGTLLCRSNPMRVVASSPVRHYWGDLHAQSEETIGTNSVEDYFTYARDYALVDIAGHQGNDFQITDDFWERLNALTRQLDQPGRFVAVPGYEWSGNTGLGGDRNVFYRHEGRPIRRSSRILVDDPVAEDCYTAGDLFAALDRNAENAIVIAHVGGRYADLEVAHDGRYERAVEVHSTWGTFEWLLHQAFALGHRVGVVCHSDDHKGRPGATRPGASTFGALGGLTCYAMPELTRDALFEALRRRHQYGTTGTRMVMSVKGAFAEPVTLYDDDPALGPAASAPASEITMGDIVDTGGAPMRLAVDVVGSAPLERVDVFHGTEIARTVRPYGAGDLGRRVRVMWSGAEYRGRGREVVWRGTATLEGNRFTRFEQVNFLNPENKVVANADGTTLTWRSVTTGNMAGFDIWLEDPRAGRLTVTTNVASVELDLADLGEDEVVVEAGGLARRLRVYRLPEGDSPAAAAFEHEVKANGGGDLPVYVRVTQQDGHQAWSSPIYLIG